MVLTGEKPETEAFPIGLLSIDPDPDFERVAVQFGNTPRGSPTVWSQF
jgi:hypothetical protein